MAFFLLKQFTANRYTYNFVFFFFSIIFSPLFFFLLFDCSLYDAREFSNERGRVERRAQFHKCRSRQMFSEAMSAYLDWITQAGVCYFLALIFVSPSFTLR
jgi:hypothetical protein